MLHPATLTELYEEFEMFSAKYTGMNSLSFTFSFLTMKKYLLAPEYNRFYFSEITSKFAEWCRDKNLKMTPLNFIYFLDYTDQLNREVILEKYPEEDSCE